ncbi:MAG: HlyD family efflux transporter periplasmic adaptor subunit [Massilia sp.]
MKRAIAIACAMLCSACGQPDSGVFAGYAEGDYVRLSAPLAGTLVKLDVQRGQQARLGAPAYVLEQASESAARQEAQSRLEHAQAVVADLKKGARSDELAAIAAELREAEAALALSQANLARDRKLVADQFISRARLDQADADVAANRARVAQASARLRSASAGARRDQIAAAEKEADAARAQLAQAQWRVDQKASAIPVAGVVTDIAYRVGEWVPAGAPIVTLLPPANIKARFFIPEAQLGRIKLGQAASIACDGCAAPIRAHISFIAPEAEYTSPLIYSKENRAALVFMVEAAPEPGQAASLHPGQPLTVRPAL